jgi:hypothetical protein
LRFPLNGFTQLGARRELGAKALNGNVGIEFAIMREEDFAHAATAYDGSDLIAVAQDGL